MNLCAFVTGNQAGSPMPPRPPSQHESNPSSRMTQSPMATSKDTLFTACKCIQPVQESSAVKWFKFVEAQFVMNDQQIMNYIWNQSLFIVRPNISPWNRISFDTYTNLIGFNDIKMERVTLSLKWEKKLTGLISNGL